MALRPKQLAKLRALARAQHELELRHESRRDAWHAAIDYTRGLKAKIADLTSRRDLALRGLTEESATRGTTEARFNPQIDALRADAATADTESELLQQQLSDLTQFSAPLRELINRLLQSQNLRRGDVGINFNPEYRGPAPERISIDGSGGSTSRA